MKNDFDDELTPEGQQQMALLRSNANEAALIQVERGRAQGLKRLTAQSRINTTDLFTNPRDRIRTPQTLPAVPAD